MSGLADDPELATIEAIYDALDGGDPQRALELGRAALERSPAEDPVLRFLCGRALFEDDRPAEAEIEFRRALEIDRDDPEFRAYAAWAAFRACRFDAAEELLGPARRREARLPEPHHVRALLLERRGDYAGADREFAKAAELEPEWFPRPCRMSAAEFDARLTEAKDALEPQFRRHLDRLELIVDALPPSELLLDSDPPLDPEQLLGFFVGIPLPEQSSFSSGGELPPRIFLFKRNLERLVSDPEELAEQIRITLFHELGHYLGMDEDDLDGSGYA
jgi:predicted Zn-dependent protease with MMP-like domain